MWVSTFIKHNKLKKKLSKILNHWFLWILSLKFCWIRKKVKVYKKNKYKKSYWELNCESNIMWWIYIYYTICIDVIWRICIYY